MLRALHTFHANGRSVIEGEEIDPTDPIVKGREVLFETVEGEAPAAKPARRTAKKAAAK